MRLQTVILTRKNRMTRFTGRNGMWAVACMLAAIIGLAGVTTAQAQIRGPYAVDANTMHLWHLDEVGTPAADQAHYNYVGTFTTKPDANQPLNALFGTAPATTASLGTASFAGFGTALSTAGVSQTPPYPANSLEPGLGALAPINGTGDNVDHTFDHPTTHAFSMEAIIKFTLDPTIGWSQPQEIIAGEGDAGDSSDRSWQFRLEAHTAGATRGFCGSKRSADLAARVEALANFNLDANVPIAGTNALAQNGFYHVAVTYNGDLNDAASLKLYWTKLDPSNSAASLIGSGNMNGWLREQDTDFALGNEMRDFNGNTEPYVGLIDEVRISDIARAANAFIFGPLMACDADGNNVCDIADFNAIKANLFNTGASRAQGDLTGDTIVDFADYRIWKSAVAPAVAAGASLFGTAPEPSTCLLLAVGGVTLAAMRRRQRNFLRSVS